MGPLFHPFLPLNGSFGWITKMLRPMGGIDAELQCGSIHAWNTSQMHRNDGERIPVKKGASENSMGLILNFPLIWRRNHR